MNPAQSNWPFRCFHKKCACGHRNKFCATCDGFFERVLDEPYHQKTSTSARMGYHHLNHPQRSNFASRRLQISPDSPPCACKYQPKRTKHTDEVKTAAETEVDPVKTASVEPPATPAPLAVSHVATMDATFPSHSPPEAEAAPQPHFSTQEASALESLLFLKGIEVVLIPTDLPEEHPVRTTRRGRQVKRPIHMVE